MEAKTIEIRDVDTFIPALAIQLAGRDEAEEYLLGRSGFSGASPWGGPHVILMPLEDLGRAGYDPTFRGRTYSTVHLYLITHWSDVRSGQVLDVEFLRGETSKPKVSERLEEVEGA
jgi:hypothetical protein